MSATASASASAKRGRRAVAAAVEPAAQLALLPAREGGDARRVGGVPLDERECLQDGVVDARGDLGALGEPDPLGALGGELPEPRAEHEDQRAADRAGADEGAGGADVVEQHQRADHHEHDPGDRQGAAGAQRAAAAERNGDAADDQAERRPRRRPESPSARRSASAAIDDEGGAGHRALACRSRPRGPGRGGCRRRRRVRGARRRAGRASRRRSRSTRRRHRRRR